MKRESIQWDTVFANRVSDKRFIYKIYKDFLQLIKLD